MDYNLSTTWTIVLIVWATWELAWKGAALWIASQKHQRIWFIALLLVNSVGILPMLYLLLNYTDQDANDEKEYHHETALPIKG